MNTNENTEQNPYFAELPTNPKALSFPLASDIFNDENSSYPQNTLFVYHLAVYSYEFEYCIYPKYTFDNKNIIPIQANAL